MKSLYSQMKVFHFKEKVESLPRCMDEILAPIHVRIKPTNVCNHCCRYCAYRADSLQLGQDMCLRDAIDQAKMMEILDDLIAMNVQAVTFSGGGEPFCYPHLLEVVEKLSESPISFAALTNGSQLEGRLSEVFAHHATWLRVSIDGWDDSSYATYRNVPSGEYTKVIGNMRRFKELGGACRLGVNFIVDRENAEHVYEFIRNIHDVGADSIKISPCIVSNDLDENNTYHAPIAELVMNQVAQAISSLPAGGMEIVNSFGQSNESFAKPYSWCPYQQILPVIGADCNVYSCQDKAYNKTHGLLGSVVDQRFRDFWSADKGKFFRINPSKHCEHHCVANSKNRLVLEYLDVDSRHLGFV